MLFWSKVCVAYNAAGPTGLGREPATAATASRRGESAGKELLSLFIGSCRHCIVSSETEGSRAWWWVDSICMLTSSKLQRCTISTLHRSSIPALLLWQLLQVCAELVNDSARWHCVIGMLQSWPSMHGLGPQLANVILTQPKVNTSSTSHPPKQNMALTRKLLLPA